MPSTCYPPLLSSRASQQMWLEMHTRPCSFPQFKRRIRILTDLQCKPGSEMATGWQRAGKWYEHALECRYDGPAAVPCNSAPFLKTILNRTKLDMVWTEAAQSSLSSARLNRNSCLGQDLALANVAQMLRDDGGREGSANNLQGERTNHHSHSSCRDRKGCVIGKDSKHKVRLSKWQGKLRQLGHQGEERH